VSVAAAGCSATPANTVGPKVTGSVLAIYADAPPSDPASADVVAAERLALQQAGSQVGHYRIALHVISAPLISDDARTAIENNSTIAYLGELEPHSSYESIPITNSQGILQVSPTDTALELTKASKAVPGAPGDYYESYSSYHQTFGRIVPSSEAEAKADVKVIQQQKVTKLYVTSDGSAYGKAIALAAYEAARAAGVPLAGSGPGAAEIKAIKASAADGVFAAAQVEGGLQIARLFNAVAAANPKLKLFGPSGLGYDAFTSALLPAAQRSTYISSPGFLSYSSIAAKKFVSDFASAYGHDPGPSAIFGYEAMAVVLDSLRRAGDQAATRKAVVQAFLHTANRSSVLGTYSINSSTGDMEGSVPFVISRFKGGRLMPYESEQGT
jgi:branched-chain amino acid transport system substrate-binding protein